jgi:hypothetical protein
MNVEETIKQFSEHEAYLLYCVCRDVPYEVISKERDYTVDAITIQMKFIYARLGINNQWHYSKRRGFLREHICPILNKLIDNNPENLKNFPICTEEPSNTTEENKEPTEEPTDGEKASEGGMESHTDPKNVVDGKVLENDKPDQKAEEPRQGPSRENARPALGVRIFRLAAFSLVALFLIICISFLSFRLGINNVQSFAELNPSQTSLTPQDTSPFAEFTSTAANLVQSPTETSTIVDTPRSTETNTPLPPTQTETSTATENPNVFFDDFADGLDPAWTVVSGNPMVVNEQLTSSDAAVLSIGNPLWTNYEIEFDIKIPTGFCGLDNDRENFVGIRALDFDNMLRFDFDTCETAWHIVSAGEALTVPNTPTDYRMGSGGKMHIVVTAVDDKISLRVDTKLINSFIDSTFQSGIIFIRLRPDSLYDNFSITVFD